MALAYALALTNFDALDITKSGFVIGTYGTEQAVGKFAQAYRALPAVRFDDVEGLSDPVRVRQKVVDGRAYFYALNTLPIPVDVTLQLESGQMRLHLDPYELYSYSKEGHRPAVRGGHVEIDPGFVETLRRQLRVAEESTASVIEAAPYLLLQESWNRAVRQAPQ
jgi:hypothetical protein